MRTFNSVCGIISLSSRWDMTLMLLFHNRGRNTYDVHDAAIAPETFSPLFVSFFLHAHRLTRILVFHSIFDSYRHSKKGSNEVLRT